MFNFLVNNIGTILTGLGLLVIVAAIIKNIRWNRKKNRCAGCPYGCKGIAGCG